MVKEVQSGTDKVNKFLSIPIIHLLMGAALQLIVLGVYIGTFKEEIASIKHDLMDQKDRIEKIETIQSNYNDKLENTIKMHGDILYDLKGRNVAVETKMDMILQGMVNLSIPARPAQPARVR